MQSVDNMSLKGVREADATCHLACNLVFAKKLYVRERKEGRDFDIIFVIPFSLLQSSSSLYFLLGVNPKVRQSIHTMFSLAHSYGNILREGWKDLLDCLLALFKAGLLPQHMVEVCT